MPALGGVPGMVRPETKQAGKMRQSEIKETEGKEKIENGNKKEKQGPNYKILLLSRGGHLD